MDRSLTNDVFHAFFLLFAGLQGDPSTEKKRCEHTDSDPPGSARARPAADEHQGADREDGDEYCDGDREMDDGRVQWIRNEGLHETILIGYDDRVCSSRQWNHRANVHRQS
jgi:hypothetical protein